MLVGFLAAEVRRQNALLLEALYLPVERRVRQRLLELVESRRAWPGDPARPGTSSASWRVSATVNRVLRDEERRGTIELRRGRTIVRNPDALRRPVV